MCFTKRINREKDKLTIILRQIHTPISSLLAHFRIDGAGVDVVDANIGVLGGDGLSKKRALATMDVP